MSRKQYTVAEVWPMLQDGIEKLLVSMESIKQDVWMAMYSGVYNLCICRHEKELYDTFKDWMLKHCQLLYKDLAELRRFDLLLGYLKKWNHFVTGVHYVHKIFDYMHRYWVPKNKQTHNAEDITTLSYNTWREKGFNKLKDHLLEALLDQITRDRKGEQVDRSMLRDVIGSFVKLGTNKNQPLEVYKADFEKAFIQKTREFFTAESSEYLAANGCALYMSKVDQRIKEEDDRLKSFLDPSTESELMSNIDDVLITQHKESFQTDFRSFLETDRRDDLGRMYKLLSRLKDGLGYIKSVLKTWARDQGMDEVKKFSQLLAEHSELRKSPPAVEAFIKLNDLCYDLVAACFSKNPDFEEAVDQAFVDFTNKLIGAFQMAELLAFYCDAVLKGAIKLTDDEMEATFDKVAKLFKYLVDKDMFHAFFRRFLSRRLLSGKANEDAERSIIARFREEYGGNYVSKLEGMINDMNATAGMRTNFLNSSEAKACGSVSMEVLVLNQLHWPIYKSEGDKINLPAELLACQEAFNGYYTEHTKNRRLSWVYSHSNAQLQLLLGKSKYDLMCSTYQACIMLLFNAQTEMSFHDIQSALGLGPEDLAMCIEPLVGISAKFEILKREGEGKIVKPSDKFSWNEDLVKAKPPRRIPVPPTSGRAVQKEQKATSDHVMEERKFKVDAAIVRIMKQRRRLHVNDLTAEVIQQLTKYFKPDPRQIKKCIESLIEREYIDREESDTSTFRYIA